MMAELRTAPFVMHSARDAMAAGLTHIEAQVKGIEQAVVENPSLVFDLAKTLIESTCRTVLGDRSIAYADTDDLPDLFRSVSRHLPFLPSTASEAAKVRKSLKKTLGGISTAIQGICELRNQCGFTSHGSDGPRPVMEGVQALLAAEAADTIIGFLHRVHRQDRTSLPAARASFDDNFAFNESLDEAFSPFRIIDVEFRPSEVLFTLEPETYRIYVADFDGGADSETIASVGGEVRP